MSDYPYKNIPAELLEALLENPHESQIIVDAQGIVRYMSASNESFYKVTRKHAIGRHILELNPESELPRVLKQDAPRLADCSDWGIKSGSLPAYLYAIRKGNVIGAVGKLMFWNPEKVKELVRQVEVLQSRLDYYEKELQQAYRSRYSWEAVIGESAPMQEAKQIAMQASASDLPVLIVGETGTGKEIFAHAIHQLSASSSTTIGES